ncbi:MAG: sulfite exporter TauE/SafE family protein [Acidimicrobiales bacterium]
MTGIELGLAALIIGIGALVQGSIGFGMNIVAAPLLVLIDTALVPGPTLAAAVVLTLLITVREHEHIEFSGLGWALAGRVPGTVLGALALLVLSTKGLTVLFAVLVLGAVALSTGWHIPRNASTLFAAGGLSGFMSMTTSIGGPPMALVYQRASGSTLRATLSGYFLVGGVISVIGLAAVGRFGRDELVASAVLLPGLVIGFGLSRFTGHLLDRAWLRPTVLVVAATSAVIALIQALW